MAAAAPDPDVVDADASLPPLKETLVWRCGECKAECFPITDQSFCLCGHRNNAHEQGGSFPCKRCPCAAFYYIIVQGSWRLRCSCKHKATEHEVGGEHACKKPRCQCEKFYSPFTCNCDHKWAAHEQTIEWRRPKTLRQVVAQLGREATGGTVLRRGAHPEWSTKAAEERKEPPAGGV